jgi:hypothetical protein
MRFDISAKIVRGLPLVARILSASVTRRGSARFLKLQTLMSSAGRLRMKLGKLRQMLFVGAGTSVGELFVPPTLHGRQTLKATPLDDRGHTGRTISLRVNLG